MEARSPFWMMERPPADRHLDSEAVRTVVRTQFPDCPAATATLLGSGWEHDAYVVDESIVFRFPRYADVARGLKYDVEVHALVSAVRRRRRSGADGGPLRDSQRHLSAPIRRP